MANIRNTRRNYARPSGTFTAAASAAAITTNNGKAVSSIQITKITNPIGVLGNNKYNLVTLPSNITATTTTSATTATINFSIPPAVFGVEQTLTINEENYNGTGKPAIVATTLTPSGLFTSQILVIAGGGAGGGVSATANRGGGGGGAGGYREFSNFALQEGVAYTVTVGAGGAAGEFAALGSNGSSSRFVNVTSDGGGRAGSSTERNGAGGGSGGGAGSANTTATNSGGATVGIAQFQDVELYSVQGFNGGDKGIDLFGLGAGGGASQVGLSNTASANGGNGRDSSITGTNITRGGGGAGGQGTGGTGGGGNAGGGGTAVAGTENTGGGGGGNLTTTSVARNGASGGSGIVIIRIPTTHTATFSNGVTSSLSTSVSGFNIYSVTATSTTSETVTFSAA